MRSARFVLLASAVALAACTSMPTPAPSGDVASAIVPGTTTKADVETLAGAPLHEFDARGNRAAESVYLYNDPWGYKSELSVQYDESGVVKSTFSETLPEN